MSTPIAVVADDYAIAPGVSAAIRELLDAGRISATSAMTTSAVWDDEGPRLRRFVGRADLGLHLVLTDGAPCGPMPSLAPSGRFPGMRQLFRLAWAGRLDAAEVEVELHRQLDRFEAATGAPPDHIDGHQHVHQLPVVREALVRVAQERLERRAWLRCTAESAWTIVRRGVAVPKALLLAAAAAPLRRMADGLPQNKGFSGVYGFDSRLPYPARFARFLDHAGPGMLVMTHPGTIDEVLRAADPVTDAREAELRFLLSDELPALLAARGLRLSRLRDALPSPPSVG